MYHPRLRLDTGTWGVMGIGMGYSIGAAVTSGKQVLAIEGDSPVCERAISMKLSIWTSSM